MGRPVTVVVVAVMAALALASCVSEPPQGPATSGPVPTSASPTPTSPSSGSPTSPTTGSRTVLLHDGSASSQVVQGADSNLSDSIVPSVLVLIEADRVAVVVCGGQDAQAGAAADTCNGTYDGYTIDGPPDGSMWTGTRDGDRAVVVGADPYWWGTVTFDGPGPDAVPITFAIASGCVDVFGNQGSHDMAASGRCVPGAA